MKLELKQHSKFSASSMSRIVACPGSVPLSVGVEESNASDYAVEGTVAHEVAEVAITPRKRFRSLLGKSIEVSINSTETIKIKVDQEMIDGAEVYKTAVASRVKGLESVAEVKSEVSLDMSWIYPGFGGTTDCVITVPFEKLIVIDYKYGAGVEVEPEWNDQLISYALGALGPKNEPGVQEVEVVVVQPRRYHPDGPVRSWSISVEGLYKKADEYIEAFQRAEAATPELQVTEKGCRWCPAKRDCPEIRAEAFRAAKVEMDPRNIPVKGATLPSVANLTPSEIGRILELHKPFTQWIDQVKDKGLEMLRAGEEVPGVKLVKSKTIRSWASAEEAEQKLSGYCDMYAEPKLLTPAQAEKAIKEKGYKAKEAGEIVSQYTTQEVSTTFASNSDKRPAYNLLEDARDAFKSVANATNDDIFS